MSKNIIETIEKFSKATEAAQLVEQYRAELDGEEIKVEIYDRPVDGMYRYSVTAYVVSDPSRRGHGNGGDTIEDALATFHWNGLKKK